MVEERIGEILRECVGRHDLLAAAAEHRIGRVPRGEPGVVVAVSAGHREEAFAGAREAIDRIKAEAPIWKRELDAAGAATWVEGTAAPEAGTGPERAGSEEEGRSRAAAPGPERAGSATSPMKGA
jgi:molybdopterin synthase catalytic subunit